MCEVKDKVFLYAVFMIISISMVTGCGCGESADSAKPGGGGGKDVWSVLTEEGRWNELVTLASAEFQKDTAGGYYAEAVYPAAHLAQSYLFMDKYDSSAYYLGYMEKYLSGTADRDGIPSAEMYKSGLIYYNTKAIMAMKTGLDYTSALEYMNKAAGLAEQERDSVQLGNILSNMSMLYCSRGDTAGLPYALKAYILGKSFADDNIQCRNNIHLSEIYFLSENYVQSLKYALEAVELCRRSGYKGNALASYRLCGDIYSAMGDSACADDSYRMAGTYYSQASDSDIIQYLHSYADFLSRRGEYFSAMKMYEDGLAKADSTGNIEFLSVLLEGLSAVYDSLSLTEKAFDTYKRYHYAEEASFNRQSENRFNNLLRHYEQMAYNEELREKELEIAEKEKNAVMAIAVAAMAVLTLAYFSHSYLRSRKMYARLAMQYNNYKKKMENMALIEKMRTENASKTYLKVFQDVEELMSGRKIYRDKNISVQTVADMLSSNGTYISKAINQCSGMSFNNYINSYRIKEIISALSDPSDDRPLKQIADEAGYGNIATMYRYFQKETGMSPVRFREHIRKIL